LIDGSITMNDRVNPIAWTQKNFDVIDELWHLIPPRTYNDVLLMAEQDAIRKEFDGILHKLDYDKSSHKNPLYFMLFLMLYNHRDRFENHDMAKVFFKDILKVDLLCYDNQINNMDGTADMTYRCACSKSPIFYTFRIQCDLGDLIIGSDCVQRWNIVDTKVIKEAKKRYTDEKKRLEKLKCLGCSIAITEEQLKYGGRCLPCNVAKSKMEKTSTCSVCGIKTKPTYQTCYGCRGQVYKYRK
jgi:hypothetical protein